MTTQVATEIIILMTAPWMQFINGERGMIALKIFSDDNLAECEAKQWVGMPGNGDLETDAKLVVAWVNVNGGEARYEDHAHMPVDDCPNGPVIAVRTINGWAYAAPGHYIVKGTAQFLPTEIAGKRTHPYRTPLIRDFYPCDPETPQIDAYSKPHSWSKPRPGVKPKRR